MSTVNYSSFAECLKNLVSKTVTLQHSDTRKLVENLSARKINYGNSASCIGRRRRRSSSNSCSKLKHFVALGLSFYAVCIQIIEHQRKVLTSRVGPGCVANSFDANYQLPDPRRKPYNIFIQSCYRIGSLRDTLDRQILKFVSLE